MEPSRTLQEEREQAIRERMARLKSLALPGGGGTDPPGNPVLKRFQTEPDPPEAVATLPRLARSATSPARSKRSPRKGRPSDGVPALIHDLFTNGIAYLDLAFDVSDVPEELQPYLPLLGKLTVQMGAAGLSYEAMAKRIALRTGGLGVNLATGLTADGTGNWQKMLFSVKALYRNVDEAIGIVGIS